MLGNHGAIMTPAKVACLPRLRLANCFLLRSDPATKSGTALGLQQPKNACMLVGQVWPLRGMLDGVLVAAPGGWK